MKEFQIIKPNNQENVDVGKIHKLLAAAGYDVVGCSYDSEANQLTIMLGDAETKDPSNDPIITSYVYVAPTVHDWPALYQTAKAEYQTAQSAYTAAADAYTAAPTQAKLAAAVQAQNDVSKTLAEILVMFAKNRALEPEDE
jgi:nucleoside diphosphate kinase